MSRKYKFRDNAGIYFVSFTVVYWLDIFIRNEYKDILLKSWEHCKKEKGLIIYAWVIMTSHVHMILGSHKNKPEDIIRDMKSFTSRQIRNCIQENPCESRKEWLLWMMQRAGKKNSNNKSDFQFWQQHNHPLQLVNNQMMDQKLDYIHNNPVEAGFVQHPENYLYSSAIDYTGHKGLIDIERLG